MKRNYLKTLMLLIAGLLLTCCSGSQNNFPDDYVGFNKTYINHSYSSTTEEEVIDLDVIASNKSSEDRVVRLSINKPPIGSDSFALSEKEVVIKAGKKKATTTVKVFPNKVVKGVYIHVTCTPQWKDATATKMTIQLTPK